jgi:hypothetical protein
LILRVWRPLVRQPFYIALLDALERHLGPDVTEPFHRAFSLADQSALRSLIKKGGFSHVHISITSNMMRFPSIERYVSGYLAATPVAAQVAAMHDDDRVRLIGEVATALQSYVDDDGLAAPIENHVVIAYKQAAGVELSAYP